MFLFFVVIGIALISWWLGRRSVRLSKPEQIAVQINKSYFKGLNHLLNEENDKALEAFVKSMRVDSDTMETHLALGGLFRRRGELTRAIHIHQNLLARPTLTVPERTQAQLALAYDYLAAGMLDRAEQTFLIVAEQKTCAGEAWYRLLDIYQREKRWYQAIEIAKQLLRTGDSSVRLMLAHYCCELAELALQAKDYQHALSLLANARQYQAKLARIDLLTGDVFCAQGNWQKALQAYVLVVEDDIDYLSEAIPKIVKCHEQLGTSGALEAYLRACQAKTKRTVTAIALTQCLIQHAPEEALSYLQDTLKEQPSLRGIVFLIDLQNKLAQQNGAGFAERQTFYELAKALLQTRAHYRCGHCGFSGKILFWQCPGCKRWSTMKPIHGIEGD